MFECEGDAEICFACVEWSLSSNATCLPLERQTRNESGHWVWGFDELLVNK